MEMAMTEHSTVVVSVGDQVANIDEEIAPLIEEIWKTGIETTNSCQENRPGIAWIGFLTALDAADFLDAVAGEYSDEIGSLYNRIRKEWDEGDGETIGWWEYDARPWDASVNQWKVSEAEIDEAPVDSPEFVFAVSVRFPKSDMPYLIERMRAFNESERGADYRQLRGLSQE
jgi:hypothetical protein